MKKTYGGLPVTDEYLKRYGVQSDQEVYTVIVVALLLASFLMISALAVIWVLE